MSHDDRFTSAIVRHVCGVRSLCKSCSGQRAQRVWCKVSESIDERVDGSRRGGASDWSQSTEERRCNVPVAGNTSL